MRKALGAVLAATAVVMGALPAAIAATPPQPGLGIRLLDAPTSLQNDPRALVYIIDHVKQGTTFTRHVEVSNGSNRPAHITMYPDAAAVSGGGFEVAPGRTANELTSWISVTPSTLDLLPNGVATVAVTIAVPLRAPSGERYAAVLAEQDSGTTQPGIRLARRAGIRVYLDVGTGSAPAIDFRITTLTAGRTPSGSPEVLAQVKNIGGRALDMRGNLWLRNGPGGLTAGPFPAKLGTTLGIGQTEPVAVILDKRIPAGPWLAHLELQSDFVKHAAEATLTFPSAPGTTASPVKAKSVPLTRNKGVLGIIAGSLIGLIALALLFLFFLWRRRRDDDDDEIGRPMPPLPAQRKAHGLPEVQRTRR